jgi:hypothetical protein
MKYIKYIAIPKGALGLFLIKDNINFETMEYNGWQNALYYKWDYQGQKLLSIGQETYIFNSIFDTVKFIVNETKRDGYYLFVERLGLNDSWLLRQYNKISKEKLLFCIGASYSKISFDIEPRFSYKQTSLPRWLSFYNDNYKISIF